MASGKKDGGPHAELRLSALQLDALKELSTIGMGNAINTFAGLIGSKVSLKLSAMELASVEEVSSIFGEKNVLVTGIYLRMRGDINGTSLLMLPRESAVSLAGILNERRKPSASGVLTELDRSSLGELGSMLTAAYLNAVTEMLHLHVELSVPAVVFNNAGDIIGFVLPKSDDNIRYSIIAQIQFVSSDKPIDGEFLFLLNEATMIKLLSSVYEQLQRNRHTPK